MDLVFLVWELGKRGLFRNNSIRHGCTAVMLNGVPLPTTVVEKVVKCWGYSRPSDGDVNWLIGGPGSRIGGEFTPLPRYPLNTYRKEKA